MAGEISKQGQSPKQGNRIKTREGPGVECTDIAQWSAVAIAISTAPPDNRPVVS